MPQTDSNHNKSPGPNDRVARGRIYFTRSAERRFYFILTLFMLAAGILYRLGVF